MATTYHDNVSPQVQYIEAAPTIRTIGLSDLRQALRQGWEDFKAVPSHAIILCVIYPVLGLLLARATFGYAVIPLLFPLAAGFALLGPFAALGLYELSARRERGQEPSASDAIEVLRSPSFGAMLGLGALLLALFVTWVATAQAIYVAAFGYEGVELFDLHGHDPETVGAWLSELGLVAVGRHARLEDIETKLPELAAEARELGWQRLVVSWVHPSELDDARRSLAAVITMLGEVA